MASTAGFPMPFRRHPPIERALACIAQSGKLNGYLFAVGPFVGSTGKFNSVALGSTGNFLPQADSASFITDSIRCAGGQVLVQYFGSWLCELDFGQCRQGRRQLNVSYECAIGWQPLGTP